MEPDCVFCNFVTGETEHRNGYPFIPTYETENTISFLSIDFPASEDGHLLVIPKEHYKNVEDIPTGTMHELSDHVALACKVTRENHAGCNVLLNDGEAAGQYVMHAHFHIVPRDPEDDIDIEIWDEKQMSEDAFRELSHRIKDRFQHIS